MKQTWIMPVCGVADKFSVHRGGFETLLNLLVVPLQVKSRVHPGGFESLISEFLGNRYLGRGATLVILKLGERDQQIWLPLSRIHSGGFERSERLFW